MWSPSKSAESCAAQLIAGGAAGMTGFDAADSGPVPTPFTARTVNVYLVPFVVPLKQFGARVKLARQEAALSSGLIRLSFVGPCELYGATVVPFAGSIAPTESAPVLSTSTAGAAAL